MRFKIRKSLFLLYFLVCINFVSASLFEGWGLSFDNGINFVFLKYFLLLIFAIGIYGLFSYFNFLDNSLSQGIVAIVSAILLTLLVNPDIVLVSLSLNSTVFYIVVFLLPFIVLSATTFFALEKLDFVGIFLQKVLWAIYGVYGLIVSSGMLLFGNGFLEGLNDIFPFDYLWNYLFKYIFMFYEFVGIHDGSNASALLLLVFSILVIWFLVLNNDKTTKMIKDWMADARKIKEKDTAMKFNRARDITAAAVDNS